jgi:DNA-binding transcriptional MerR regulator
MRTVKQISDLTGISVRMLHYYDEIGLLKPSDVTDAGYRLYDEDALMTLQQILFYKELGIPLKEVKEIMYSPQYNITKALENQKKLLTLKCNRLHDLIELINKTLKGENAMSFKEFDMSEYFNALEEFKKEHTDKIIKSLGSMEKYNEFIEKCKVKEAEIAEMAIKKYGSIEKYVEAMKKNFNSDLFKIAEQCDEFRNDCIDDKHPKLKELFKSLASDINKDPSSVETQNIAAEITNIAKTDYEVFSPYMETDYWYPIVQSYLLLPDWIEKVDHKYGDGASKFIGEALKKYLGDNLPKSNNLIKKLTSDLSKDPCSEEIQEIVKAYVMEAEKQHKALKIDEGENQWSYTAELYLSESVWKQAADKVYGIGASTFIGEALNYYAEKIVKEKSII